MRFLYRFNFEANSSNKYVASTDQGIPESLYEYVFKET